MANPNYSVNEPTITFVRFYDVADIETEWKAAARCVRCM